MTQNYEQVTRVRVESPKGKNDVTKIIGNPRENLANDSQQRSGYRGRASKVERNRASLWRTLNRVLKSGDDGNDDGCDGNNDCDCEGNVRVQIAVISTDGLTDLLRRMWRYGYSASYITNAWNEVSTVTPLATKKLLLDTLDDLRVGDRRENDDDRRRRKSSTKSLKSDGRLTFSEPEFGRLSRRVLTLLSATSSTRSDSFVRNENAVDATDDVFDVLADYRAKTTAATTTARQRTLQLRRFLYVFIMLTWTGKRLSDIAAVDAQQLKQLHARGVCVIRIRKTRRLGRIEIPELLDKSRNDEEFASIRSILSKFIEWCADGTLDAPFCVQRCRDSLDRHLSAVFKCEFGVERPKGLSFHALRRMYAGYRFLRGESIAKLQENLDHASRKQTNRYVNACLYELTESESR